MVSLGNLRSPETGPSVRTDEYTGLIIYILTLHDRAIPQASTARVYLLPRLSSSSIAGAKNKGAATCYVFSVLPRYSSFSTLQCNTGLSELRKSGYTSCQITQQAERM